MDDELVLFVVSCYLFGLLVIVMCCGIDAVVFHLFELVCFVLVVFELIRF